MTKTKEELEALKEEFKSFTSKLRELDEDEFKEIVGGIREEFSILPDDDFWHSFNPFIPKAPNNLGLLNKTPQDSVNTEKPEFNGSISNRDDK